jgi:hypothetical protein
MVQSGKTRSLERVGDAPAGQRALKTTVHHSTAEKTLPSLTPWTTGSRSANAQGLSSYPPPGTPRDTDFPSSRQLGTI